MKKKMTKNTKVKPYTKEQIAYFQAQSDMGDGVVNDIQDIDYIDHLLGGVHNSYDGLQMDTSFEDLDDSSDWFMNSHLRKWRYKGRVRIPNTQL